MRIRRYKSYYFVLIFKFFFFNERFLSKQHDHCFSMLGFLILRTVFFILHLKFSYLAVHYSQQKKDANHILIPQVICFFISVSKLLTFWYRYEKNRSLVKSKYDLRLFFAVNIRMDTNECLSEKTIYVHALDRSRTMYILSK